MGYTVASGLPRLSVKRRGKSMGVFASGREGTGHCGFIPVLLIALYMIAVEAAPEVRTIQQS